jgi:hypothetical protein
MRADDRTPATTHDSRRAKNAAFYAVCARASQQRRRKRRGCMRIARSDYCGGGRC